MSYAKSYELFTTVNKEDGTCITSTDVLPIPYLMQHPHMMQPATIFASRVASVLSKVDPHKSPPP